MGIIRSRLGWLACFALSAQLVGAAVAPAALCCTAESADGQMMECCRKGGAHICPMTQKAAADQVTTSGGDEAAGCVMTACRTPSSGALEALFGPAGVVVAPQSSPSPESVRLPSRLIDQSAASVVVSADLPPPRI